MEAGKKEGADRKRLVIVYVAMLALVFAVSFVIQYKVSTESQVQKCSGSYACLSGLANKTGNSSICGLMRGSYSDNCYFSIAQSTLNSSLCDKITNITYSAYCLDLIALNTGNMSLCSKAVEPYQSYCYSSFANKQLEPSICTSISNGTIRTICYSEVLAKIAFDTKNLSYCANVSNSTNASVTNAVMNNATPPSLRNATLQLSGYLLQPGAALSPKEFCEIGVGYFSGNKSICSIVPLYLTSLCTQIMSSRSTQQPLNFTQELQACNSAGKYELLCKQAVLLSEAVSTHNLSICSGMNASSSYVCYAAVAKAEKNQSICQYIANQSLATACIESLSLNMS
ncbi:MAG: hypothetical protein ACP5MC_01270 [Candidatus Micrarchaeia archaeon]